MVVVGECSGDYPYGIASGFLARLGGNSRL